jgi:hypothetical protein
MKLWGGNDDRKTEKKQEAEGEKVWDKSPTQRA